MKHFIKKQNSILVKLVVFELKSCLCQSFQGLEMVIASKQQKIVFWQNLSINILYNTFCGNRRYGKSAVNWAHLVLKPKYPFKVNECDDRETEWNSAGQKWHAVSLLTRITHITRHLKSAKHVMTGPEWQVCMRLR